MEFGTFNRPVHFQFFSNAVDAFDASQREFAHRRRIFSAALSLERSKSGKVQGRNKVIAMIYIHWIYW
jgi:hypothetical protein